MLTHTHTTLQDAQAAVLAQLLAGGSTALEAYFDYTGRHVVDVLRTFPAARISITQVRAAVALPGSVAVRSVLC